MLVGAAVIRARSAHSCAAKRNWRRVNESSYPREFHPVAAVPETRERGALSGLDQLATGTAGGGAGGGAFGPRGAWLRRPEQVRCRGESDARPPPRAAGGAVIVLARGNER